MSTAALFQPAVKARSAGDQRPTTAPAPARFLARGSLHRAIVSLPQQLCPRDEPLHERIVFFDAPMRGDAGKYLENLLAAAWALDTAGWCQDGLIYNVQRSFDLIAEGQSTEENSRLFELSWGGPDGVGYAQPGRVDLLVAPVLKARLQAAIDDLVRRGLTA